jgi:hypothetical protein
MAEIEARWQLLPGGFHGERKRIKVHVRAVADVAQSMSSEELCWLAIAAASAWVPNPAFAEVPPRQSRAPSILGSVATRRPGNVTASISGMPDTRT